MENVVIFINGLADPANQGNSSYWRYTEKYKTTYNSVTHRNGSPHYHYVEHAFDKDVMNQLGDNKQDIMTVQLEVLVVGQANQI